MSSETPDGLAPVRRTSRARKVNSRFVGDGIDEEYRKLVDRITASDSSRDKEKCLDVDAKLNKETNSCSGYSSRTASIADDFDENSNIDCDVTQQANSGNEAVATTVNKEKVGIKVVKSNAVDGVAEEHGKLSKKPLENSRPFSHIVKYRSSTDTDSEDEIQELDPLALDTPTAENAMQSSLATNACIDQVQLFALGSRETAATYSANIEVKPKVILTSNTRMASMPGKKLKILSLKPLSGIRSPTPSTGTVNSVDSPSVTPLSSPKERVGGNKGSSNFSTGFSSDGEDDMPLTSFIKKTEEIPLISTFKFKKKPGESLVSKILKSDEILKKKKKTMKALAAANKKEPPPVKKQKGVVAESKLTKTKHEFQSKVHAKGSPGEEDHDNVPLTLWLKKDIIDDKPSTNNCNEDVNLEQEDLPLNKLFQQTSTESDSTSSDTKSKKKPKPIESTKVVNNTSSSSLVSNIKASLSKKLSTGKKLKKRFRGLDTSSQPKKGKKGMKISSGLFFSEANKTRYIKVEENGQEYVLEQNVQHTGSASNKADTLSKESVNTNVTASDNLQKKPTKTKVPNLKTIKKINKNVTLSMRKKRENFLARKKKKQLASLNNDQGSKVDDDKQSLVPGSRVISLSNLVLEIPEKKPAPNFKSGKGEESIPSVTHTGKMNEDVDKVAMDASTSASKSPPKIKIKVRRHSKNVADKQQEHIVIEVKGFKKSIKRPEAPQENITSAEMPSPKVTSNKLDLLSEKTDHSKIPDNHRDSVDSSKKKLKIECIDPKQEGKSLNKQEQPIKDAVDSTIDTPKLKGTNIDNEVQKEKAAEDVKHKKVIETNPKVKNITGKDKLASDCKDIATPKDKTSNFDSSKKLRDFNSKTSDIKEKQKENLLTTKLHEIERKENKHDMEIKDIRKDPSLKYSSPKSDPKEKVSILPLDNKAVDVRQDDCEQTDKKKEVTNEKRHLVLETMRESTAFIESLAAAEVIEKHRKHRHKDRSGRDKDKNPIKSSQNDKSTRLHDHDPFLPDKYLDTKTKDERSDKKEKHKSPKSDKQKDSKNKDKSHESKSKDRKHDHVKKNHHRHSSSRSKHRDSDSKSRGRDSKSGDRKSEVNRISCSTRSSRYESEAKSEAKHAVSDIIAKNKNLKEEAGGKTSCRGNDTKTAKLISSSEFNTTMNRSELNLLKDIPKDASSTLVLCTKSSTVNNKSEETVEIENTKYEKCSKEKVSNDLAAEKHIDTSKLLLHTEVVASNNRLFEKKIETEGNAKVNKSFEQKLLMDLSGKICAEASEGKSTEEEKFTEKKAIEDAVCPAKIMSPDDIIGNFAVTEPLNISASQKDIKEKLPEMLMEKISEHIQNVSELIPQNTGNPPAAMVSTKQSVIESKLVFENKAESEKDLIGKSIITENMSSNLLPKSAEIVDKLREKTSKTEDISSNSAASVDDETNLPTSKTKLDQSDAPVPPRKKQKPSKTNPKLSESTSFGLAYLLQRMRNKDQTLSESPGEKENSPDIAPQDSRLTDNKVTPIAYGKTSNNQVSTTCGGNLPRASPQKFMTKVYKDNLDYVCSLEKINRRDSSEGRDETVAKSDSFVSYKEKETTLGQEISKKGSDSLKSDSEIYGYTSTRRSRWDNCNTSKNDNFYGVDNVSKTNNTGISLNTNNVSNNQANSEPPVYEGYFTRKRVLENKTPMEVLLASIPIPSEKPSPAQVTPVETKEMKILEPDTSLIDSVPFDASPVLIDRDIDDGDEEKNKKEPMNKESKLIDDVKSVCGPDKKDNSEEKSDLKVEDVKNAKNGDSDAEDDKENILPQVKEDNVVPNDVTPPKELSAEEKADIERMNAKIVQERMKSFELLEVNLYLGEKKHCKRSKEMRRMVCDCSLTKEEMANGEMGCGEDCLNRLLMIECGSRCPLKDHCLNKHFQQKKYSKVEVFNAQNKGCGVRACEDVSSGTFIMEYVGEVFDTREFKRRRKEYAKSSSNHFYFMALRADRLIDATRKGNISRFVNHSCDPNCETQKWTINGEVRVGFFATKHIAEGEELNFDYRLERYGREPQKCFCGTSICRGWLGESPDEKTKEEKEEDKRKEIRRKERKEEKRLYFDNVDLEDEIEKLNFRGLRNRQDTLDLSRLMVRAEETESRLSLLDLLKTAEPACRRLFLDYHGLKLLWSWMADMSSSSKNVALKIEILKTLDSLPVTNKTQLLDSRILSIVERWNKMVVEEKKLEEEATVDVKAKDGSKPKKSSDTSEDSEDAEAAESSETPSPDENSLDANETKPPAVDDVPVEEDKQTESTVSSLANELISKWNNLKEAYRIPKKERIEMMKEHEREVDQGYKESLSKEGDSGKDRYEGWGSGSRDRDRERERDRDRRNRRRQNNRRRRSDDDKDDKGLSKEERREKFALQVAKEDEERQRKLQEDMWALHLERCSLLGHDPYFTPIFDPTGEFFWDPKAGSWQPYIGPDQQLPVPATYGQPMANLDDQLQQPQGFGNGMFVSGAFFPLPFPPPPPDEDSPFPQDGAQIMDLSSIPLPGEGGAAGNPPAAPFSIDAERASLRGADTPPMPPPGSVTIILPPKWKMARNSDGFLYFYHTKTRVTQWNVPSPDQHKKLLADFGLSTESDSDLDSESSTSTSSDSEEFSSEEEEEEEESEVTVVQTSDGTSEKMIRRPKRKRSERLVQERVISPILFEDREAARRERREAKDRARLEARNERWQMYKSSAKESAVAAVIAKRKEDINSLSEIAGAASPPDDYEDDDFEDEDDSSFAAQLLRAAKRQRLGGAAAGGGGTHIKAKVRSKERMVTAMADTSDFARKRKDNFRAKMATYIVSVLNPYRKSDCKEGKIDTTEDFKYLARKLTHFVLVKELKQLPSIEGLDCSESVKHKTKEFVRKYMSKYGSKFKRDPNDTKEY